ncbi:MAG: LPXTG cell wall anchor domain-containing protein [Oscillospiraceae bacterium]|nr:LPXTG cell wall anchor domain-containing protein [Oscillospiraceae bacterium]MBQ6465319.1 LPXTG cell wall anchor domain-containing protein [Oscillospiraceae bacterium]
MKKIFAFLLAVMLLVSLSAAAFADNFINSVANAGAPELSSAKDANGNDASGIIVITPYIDREKLDDSKKENLEKAFDSLRKAPELAGVNAELKEAAGDKSVAASDLFDISATQEVSFPVGIVMKDEFLDDFVALLHYVDGEWTWVDAEVKDNELSYSIDELGAYAIIVAAEPATSAQTGETVSIGFVVAAAVFAIAAGYFFTKSRKVKA